MTSLSDHGTLDAAGHRLEYRMTGPRPVDAPTLVLLHEGLGSAGLWGDVPERLAAATGAGVFAYSRPGYGRSGPAARPRPMTYMHEEAADVLPAVLDQIGFARGLLAGHSDGASIATLYAGGCQDHRIRGLVLLAPHFVVEEVGLDAIRAAKVAYETGELKTKLARWHDDVEGAFRGWNDAWLDPAFRDWDISDALGYVRVPIQIVQGEADPYGTVRQIEIAEAECYCPVEPVMLPGIGHDPFRQAPDETLAAVAALRHPHPPRPRGWLGPGRVTATLAFPAWAHVPGTTAGADEAPLEGAKTLVPARFEGRVPVGHPAVAYGFGLCDAGFFWEAHEVLEAAWLAAPLNGRDRTALRAAIQLANAGLKLKMGRRRAALRLLAEVAGVLADLGAGRGTDPAGSVAAALAGEELARAVDDLSARVATKADADLALPQLTTVMQEIA